MSSRYNALLFCTPFNPITVSPLFATLADSSQLAENKTTLSLVFATLTRCVKPKSFACHSYKKTPGVGVPRQLLLIFPTFNLQTFQPANLQPANVPHTRSAIAPSILWKKNSPPSTTATTIPDEASSNGPGGCPCPVSAHRNPSITPAMGLSPYSHRHRCGTRELGYATGDANIQN